MSAITRKILTVTSAIAILGGVSASAAARQVGVAFTHPLYHERFWFGPHVGGRWYHGAPYAYVYPYGYTDAASIRTDVTPKQAEVFVDGYYAGRASDFDGAFTHLRVRPGGHEISLFLDGYRTVTDEIYVRPDSTFKMDSAMQPLAAGETSAPVPLPQDLPAQTR